MSAIHWSIVLAKIDLVSLYFRLLWYHSILKGSIDQYSKIHSPLACSRWLPWFPDLSRSCVACVKRGSGETCVRSQSLSSESAVKSIPTCPTSVPRQAKKDSNIPSPGRTRLVKCPIPGPTKIIKSLPHALPPPPPPPPAGFTLIIIIIIMYYNIWAYEGWNQRWKTVLAIHTVVWICLWADETLTWPSQKFELYRLHFLWRLKPAV